MKRATAKKPRRTAAEPKREATRRRLLERALKLFQQRGVEATTMRDVAKAAGLSLGAAYYYFPSKEALVFAYYEEHQREIEELELAGSLRERLGTLFHGKLEAIRAHRKMLISIIPRLVDPGDPLSAFSAQTRAVRERAIASWRRALAAAELPEAQVDLVAQALWLVQLASMLVYIHDDSPHEQRTHSLVDDALDLLVPMLPLLATPPGRAICDRILGALSRAGIAA